MKKGFSYNFSQAKKFKKKVYFEYERVNPSPKKGSSRFSNLFGIWVFSVLKQNPKMTTESTYDVDKLLESCYCEAMFERCWIKELLRSLDKMASPKLMRAIWCRFGAGFSIITIYLVLIEILSIAQVYLLYMVKIDAVYLFYLILIFLLYIFLKFLWNQSARNIGIQLRVGIQGLLLKKVLLVDTNKISAENLTEKALRSFENLFELDPLIKNVPYLFVFIIYISFLTTFLCFKNSDHLPAILITSLVLLVLLPIKGLIYSRIKKQENRRKKASIEMIEIVEEFFKYLSQIKIYCMENKFIMKLKNLRERNRMNFDEVILSFMLLNFVTLMSFLYFSSHGQIWILPREKNVLPAIAAFQIVVFPISINSSKAIMNLIRFYKTVVSLEELLMMMDRCEQSHCPTRRKETETSLKICGVSLKTKSDDSFININLGINASKLICFSKLDILTKENLLRLLLKEVDPFEGTVEVFGKISFCSRTPWLFPRATIKQNIISSLPFNAQKFQQVLNICEMNTDFVRSLIENDVLIGECGDENIKKELAVQISIARVLFNDSDIIIFDRPLEFVSYKKSERILERLVEYVRRWRKTIITFSDTDLVLSKADRVFNIVLGSLEEVKMNERKIENLLENFESDELFSSKMVTFNERMYKKSIFRAFRLNRNTRKTCFTGKLHFTIFSVAFSGIIMELLNCLWITSGLEQNSFINWDNDGLVDIILPTVLVSIIYIFSTKYIINELLKRLFHNLSSSLSDLSIINRNKRNEIAGLLGSNFIHLENNFYSNFILCSHFLTFSILSSILMFIFTPLLGFTLLLTFLSTFYYLRRSTPFVVELLNLNDELREIIRQYYRVKDNQVLSLRSLAASDIYMHEMMQYFNRFTSTQHFIGTVEETITFWVCFISSSNIVGMALITQITGNFVYESVPLYFSLILPSLISLLIKYVYKFSYVISKLDPFLDPSDKMRVNKDNMPMETSNNIFLITPGNDTSYFHFYTYPGEMIAVTGVECTNPIYNFLGLSRHSDGLIGSKCNLIPSDPHIFRGSLKNTLNLSQINDSDLWSALSKTGISQEMKQFPLGLSTESKSWEEIFTVYQRQLLLLSVQIALKNKIVVIQTDPKNITLSEELDIYEKAKLYLNRSKVFLFSNRFHVAIKCDKVLIFKNGFFKELGTPEEFLKRGILPTRTEK